MKNSSAQAIPSFNRRTLSPRIVAPPPRLGTDGCPESLHPRPASGRPLIVGTSFPAPPKVLFERKAPQVAALSEELSSQIDFDKHLSKRRKEANQENVLKNQFRGIPKQDSIEPAADVETWPAFSASKLLKEASKKIKSIDLQDSPVLRMDKAISVVTFLGENMKTYRPIFDALAIEFKMFVTQRDGLEGEISDLHDRIELQRREHENEILRLKQEMKAEWSTIRSKAEDLATREIQLEDERRRAREISQQLARERAEMIREQDDILSVRREHESLARQFALKNKALEELVPQLEKDLDGTRAEAEQHKMEAQRSMQRVHHLEQDLSATQKEKKSITQALSHALDEQRAETRRITSHYVALKKAKQKVDTDLESAQKKIAEMTEEFQSKLEGLTPRPQFRPAAFFPPSAERSAQKVDILSMRVAHLEARVEDVEAENEVLKDALQIANAALITEDQIANKCFPMQVEPVVVLPPLPELGEEDPEGALLNRTKLLCCFPSFFVAGKAQPLQVRGFFLRDVINKVKETVEAVQQISSRTTKRVEFHMAWLANTIDTYSLQHRNDVRVPAGSLTTSEVPMGVTEQMYSLFQAALFWPTHPILRLFTCIVREEVGMWLWDEHNNFVTSVMSALVSLGHSPEREHIKKLQEILAAYGFSEPFVVAVHRLFHKTIVKGAEAPKALLMRRGSSPQGDVVEKIKVDFDPNKVITTGITAPTDKFMLSLRRILLDRVLTFNVELDRELLHRSSQDSGGQKIISSAAACSAVIAVCNVDQGTASSFVRSTVQLCQAQQRAEASCSGPPAEYSPGGLATHGMFIQGLTSQYSGSSRPYPQISVYVPSVLSPQPQHLAVPKGKGQQTGKQKASVRSGQASALVTPAQLFLTSSPSMAAVNIDLSEVPSMAFGPPKQQGAAAGNGGTPLTLFQRMFRKVAFMPPSLSYERRTSMCDADEDD